MILRKSFFLLALNLWRGGGHMIDFFSAQCILDSRLNDSVNVNVPRTVN